MKDERAGVQGERAYPHPIDLNVLPHCDVFLENGYTKEEMKMVNETRKILRDDTIMCTATAVRVPVMGGHSESVNLEFEKEFELADIHRILSESTGISVQDDVVNNVYPMPRNAEGKDDVFVGRIRRDESREKCLNLWVVSDNLRKGAATNAIQIAEAMSAAGLIKA
jgi:aspartate-semialdehyde dehydrogenase